MDSIRVTTFHNTNLSLIETLKEHDIRYTQRIMLGGMPQASGLTLEILLNGSWGVLAVALLCWAKVKSSRKIHVIGKQGESYCLQGYSADDAAKILKGASQLSAIDTESDTDDT